MAVILVVGFVILGIGLIMEKSNKELIGRIGSTVIIVTIFALIGIIALQGAFSYKADALNIVYTYKYINKDNEVIYEITYEKDTLTNKTIQTIWLTEDDYNRYVNKGKLIISDVEIEHLKNAMFK